MNALDDITIDAPPPACSDFFEAFGPKSAKDRAALIWRMPKGSAVVIDDETKS